MGIDGGIVRGKSGGRLMGEDFFRMNRLTKMRYTRCGGYMVVKKVIKDEVNVAVTECRTG